MPLLLEEKGELYSVGLGIFLHRGCFVITAISCRGDFVVLDMFVRLVEENTNRGVKEQLIETCLFA